MDATGLYTLAEIIQCFQKRSVRVMLCRPSPDLMEGLRASGIIDLIGQQNVIARLADVKGQLEAPAPAPPDAR